MKTKPFLLATAGSTVDGRVIDDKLIKEMASSYDPKTYGARLNIEHIRGISPQPPFHAYGDVLELSTAEVDVNFNGKVEKRLGLYGVFDVTEEAKQINAAGQKVYPSIEIEPNFAGKGHAYLMGCALTDSPAAIATERLAFNRQMPGTVKLAFGVEGQPSDPLALEFADAAETEAGDGFIKKFGAMLEGVFGKVAPPADSAKPEPKKDDPAPEAFAALKPLFEGLGQTFSTEMGALRTELRTELDAQAVKLKKLEDTFEKTPPADYAARPHSTGANGNLVATDC
jgi:Phage capsid scaffolding protein (GPO) serine peptidase.